MSSARTGHRGARWSAEEDRQLFEMIKAGKSPVYIAGALKRTIQSVSNRRLKLLKSGGKMIKRPLVASWHWSPEEDERLRRLAEEGRSVVTIGERLKRSKGAVYKRAQILNVAFTRNPSAK
jgi:hypothetical protein